MNENGNKYALAALKDKRATLAGEIKDLRAKLQYQVQQLDHVDATLTIFEPGFNVEKIGAKRPRRVKLFRQGELGRLIMDALRRGRGPLSTAEIVTALLAATGHAESARPALAPRVRGNLAYHERRGSVVKSGRGMSVKWALSPIAPT
jgi:hypothetical protein